MASSAILIIALAVFVGIGIVAAVLAVVLLKKSNNTSGGGSDPYRDTPPYMNDNNQWDANPLHKQRNNPGGQRGNDPWNN
ncbi:MAG: hypothetical protein Q4B26_04000, partial [Eubacteriales bacterium]|nr:hypothetical protein [Eubacteriales bacterium]